MKNLAIGIYFSTFYFCDFGCVAFGMLPYGCNLQKAIGDKKKKTVLRAVGYELDKSTDVRLCFARSNA